MKPPIQEESESSQPAQPETQIAMFFEKPVPPETKPQPATLAIKAEKKDKKSEGFFVTVGVESEAQSSGASDNGHEDKELEERSMNMDGQLVIYNDDDDMDDSKPNIYTEGEPIDPVSLTDRGFIDIARIEAGGSFGSLALVDGFQRRATTKCLTRCHLLVLNQDDWKQSEKEIQKRKTEEAVSFMRGIPVLQSLSWHYLTNKLIPHFYPSTCGKGHVIYREGDPANRVYIIKQGEFVVTKRFIHRTEDTVIEDVSEYPRRANILNHQMFKKNNV